LGGLGEKGAWTREKEGDKSADSLMKTKKIVSARAWLGVARYVA